MSAGKHSAKPARGVAESEVFRPGSRCLSRFNTCFPHTRSKTLMSRPGRELERCKRRTPIARKSRGSRRVCASDSELVSTSGTLQSGDYVRLRHRNPSRWREKRGSRRSARAWSAATQSAESPLSKPTELRQPGSIPSIRAGICSHPGVWAFSGEAWVSPSGDTVRVLTN